MATRKPTNPQLAAAAKNLASAAHHIRLAINQKLDEIGTVASGELDKAKNAALTRSGQAKRQFDALFKTAQGRLKKINSDAKKSLHKAVAEAQKTVQAAKKVVAKKVAAKKAPAKKAATKKATARRSPARKAAVKRAAARKSAA